MFRRRRSPKHIGSVTAEQWNALAVALKNRGIHPRRYVRWAYKHFRTTHKIVWVPMITSAKTLVKFEKEVASSMTNDRLLIRLQLRVVTHQIERMERNLREVLEDELLDVSDAVRYAVARKWGMSDIADRLRSSAELDIVNEPIYQELLSAFLR